MYQLLKISIEIKGQTYEKNFAAYMEDGKV